MIRTEPLISLCYTSCRPLYIKTVCAMWRTKASRGDIEVVIAVDAGDAESLDAAKKVPDAKVLVQQSEPFNCVKGWNLAAAHSVGELIVCISDDFVPPVNWDLLLLGIRKDPQDLELARNEAGLNYPSWVEEEKCVWVDDGFNPTIATLSILTRKRYQRFGWVFYPGYESMFCTPAGTKVYAADHQFKNIEDVEVGDVVVGTERQFGSRGKRKHNREFLKPAKVQRKISRPSRVVRVEFESGRRVRCTPDHLFACMKHSTKEGEGQFEYSPPEVGRKVAHVVDVPPDPPEGSERELGWLAGFYDGEGSDIFLSQSQLKNKDVCSEIERLLNKFGFDYSTGIQTSKYGDGKSHKSRVYTILGGRSEYVRFFNWLRPIRVNRGGSDKRLFCSRFAQFDKIVAVEDDGHELVYSLKTETGNYITDGFLSHNCDTEYTEKARFDGAMIDARHLLFEHIHPAANKRTQDETDVVHASQDRWNRGEVLFTLRKAQGFPNDAGTDSQPTAVRPQGRQYAAYIQAVKDDFCLWEVCFRLYEDGVRNFFFCIPDEYWSGAVTPPDEIAQIDAVVARLNHDLEDVTVKVKKFHVDSYRAEGRPRIQVETHLRNDSLNWIRSSGFQHILIVDGDELWKKGLLKLVDATIEQTGADAVACHMVPTVGLPGYPVHNAQDKVTVYIGNGQSFRDCRSPNGKIATMGFYGVYHFTATRKTMQEIVDKHRNSGHYDDPAYDFEGWIANTLPNARPGLRDVHMYKPFQIWPELRAWSKKEFADIPDTLHQYLGRDGMLDVIEERVIPPPQTSQSGAVTPHGAPKITPATFSRLRKPNLYQRAT